MKKKFHKGYLIIFIAFSAWQVSVAQSDIKFTHLTIEDGLSQSSIFCMIQDSKGFMWFGTEDGLNKYDGNKFTVYKHDPNDPNSISNSTIHGIYEDKRGAIWLGTYGGGLSRFNRNTEKFTQYTFNKNDTNSLRSSVVFTACEDDNGSLWVGSSWGHGIARLIRDPINEASDKFKNYRFVSEDNTALIPGRVRAMCKGKSGFLWIGTQRGGLIKMNAGENPNSAPFFTQYLHDPNISTSLSDNIVLSVYEDKAGVLWIGTWGGGLNKLIPGTEDDPSPEFVHYIHDPNNPKSISNNDVISITEDNNGMLWVATRNGLNRLNRNTGEFTRYLHDKRDENSISHNGIGPVLQDTYGTLWIGTHGNGLNKYDKTTQKFTHYKNFPQIENSLSSNIISSFFIEKNGLLWIGTNNGLNSFDRKRGEFTLYQHDPTDNNSLPSNKISSISIEDNGIIWIGTAAEGICKFDRNTEAYTRYKREPDCINCLSGNRVKALYEDDYGALWIATNKGLDKLDKETGVITNYRSDPNNEFSILFGILKAIYEDSHGKLWILMASHGINMFDRDTEKFIHYKHDPNNKHSISNNKVRSVYEDVDGFLWFSTLGGGLNKFDRTTEQFTHYRMKDGLPSDVIYGLLGDENGNIWMSTNNGISKFNIESQTFKNYDVSDGTQSNEFSTGAYYKGYDGEMFFGGINGFNVFYPDSIEYNTVIPDIVITGFQIFNKEVGIVNESQKDTADFFLNKHIEQTDTIVLSYKHSVFSFEFAALHFAMAERNEYAYMMEGFDAGWNYIGTRRYATYTNLDPGKYLFKVKGSNTDGIWNEKGKSIRLIITPPFWQTWWFKLSTVLFIIAGIFSYIKIRERSLKRQKKMLEEKVVIRTKQLIEQKEIVEEKNRDITDSIQYASNIQRAILPKDEELDSAIPNHFVFFKPRDIVSGDFYWFTEKRNLIFIGACDCTGHGVPGAFLSMIGNDLLNQIIIENNVDEPGKILTYLNQGIKAVFTRKDEEQRARDGMDIALAVFDKELRTVQFAGAQNPLLLIRAENSSAKEVGEKIMSANGYSLNAITGDRTSIGGRTEFDYQFTNHRVELEKNDSIYLFSDGYADQFGGNKGKKFSTRRFKELLLQVQHLDMPEQKEMINKTNFEWMEREEQIDDILVIGIKV